MTDAHSYLTPEARARVDIDRMLEAAGWVIQDRDAIDLYAGRGVAVREFLLEGNHEADYLLFVDHKALGAIEAKKQGETLTCVEPQSAKYAAAVPEHVPAALRPLPFLYESTGVETRFTNCLDPDARSREVFAVHRPETLHYSMCLANPPFGRASSVSIVNEEGDAERQDLTVYREDFWATTSNKQLNFVQHIKSILAMNGRAAVVLPDNVLFEAGAGETIRRALLRECDVHTVLRLPTGIFYAQGVKANVVFFDRKPASETPWTQDVWVYDLRTNKHFTLKQKPLTRADLDDFVACYRSTDRTKRVESERFKRFSYDEIVARDKVNLDITWLKDDSDIDAADLPDPDLLIAEIVEELTAAAAELAAAASPPEAEA